MHTWGNRLSTVATFSLTVLGVMVLALTFSSLILTTPTEKIDTKLSVASLVKMSVLPYSRNDRASFVFSLHADLRPVFHWNVKQLFVYITAHYSSTSLSGDGEAYEVNDVVVWDHIIKKQESALLHVDYLRNKYPLVDKGNHLRNTRVTFKLHWDITPFTGAIFSQTSLPGQWSNYTLPSDYKLASRKEDFNTYDDMY